MCFTESTYAIRWQLSRLGACRLLCIQVSRKTELKDSYRSVEKMIAGPNRSMNSGRWTKKWNLGFEMRMLGAHLAARWRKLSIAVRSSCWNEEFRRTLALWQITYNILSDIRNFCMPQKNDEFPNGLPCVEHIVGYQVVYSKRDDLSNCLKMLANKTTGI